MSMSSFADLIVVNAKSLTMERTPRRTEAVAVRDGRILQVGSNADVLALRRPHSRLIDAAGATLLPGLVDSHFHLLWGSLNLAGMQLDGVHEYDVLARMVSDYAAAHPARSWLAGYGASYTFFPGGQRLNRHHLDALAADRPIFLLAFDQHTAWVNTRALELAGILHGGDCPPGNEIVMAQDGTATGELREFEAYGLVRKLIPKPDAAAQRALLRQGLALAARNGITSVHNMDGNLEQLLLYADLEEAGELTARIYLPYSVTPKTPLSALVDEAIAMRQVVQSEMVRSNCIKLFMDGVIESYTGFLLEDYADRPGSCGAAIFQAEHFNQIACAADRLGLQIAVHAIGDAAVRRTLDGYQLAQQRNGRRDSRHRIEHIELLHLDDLPRFQQLGVIASMQPLHAALSAPGQIWASCIGEARWGRAFPWQTLRAAGVHLAFGSDWPVVTQNPFTGIHAALARQPWAPGQPAQAQSLFDTLAGYTRDAAYSEFQEGLKGQLRPGYYADLVLLSGDIETAPVEKIVEMQVAMTIVNGKVVYDGQ